MKNKLAAFIVSATACSAIAQTDNKLTPFGFEIGKPLDLPVCQYTTADKIVGIQQYTCLEPASQSSHNRILVHFGLKEVPPIVKGLSITVQLVDDNLESLEFATPGLGSQEKLLRIFTEKYGVATRLTKQNLQDAEGVKYETFTAIWDLPSLYVEYRPSNGNVKEGFARIETQHARQIRIDAQK
ncbi:hypothetical protein [Massilia sp. S19_KUP03_FR1]|uniref:hypothetical protein n=1 Tax=Massilia sp. S19_KUP03_FR1 TaxID=3025503 RepID=UPI002FCD9296